MSNEAAGHMVGITEHELVALVSLAETEQNHRVLEALGLLRLLEDADVVRAGVSTLLVRDVAGLEEDGETVQPTGIAASVGTIMAEAEDIVRVIIQREGSVLSKMLVVTSAHGGFFAEATRFGVQAAQPLGDVDALEFVRDVLGDLSNGRALPVPFQAEITRFPVAGDVRRSVLEVADAQRWSGADGIGGSPNDVWAGVVETLGMSDGEAARAPRRAHREG